MLTQLNRLEDATKIVSDAMHQFTGTAEEVRVVVANSQIAIKRGKVDSAIRMLGNIPFDSPAFPKAQMVKADIYLKVHCVLLAPVPLRLRLLIARACPCSIGMIAVATSNASLTLWSATELKHPM